MMKLEEEKMNITKVALMSRLGLGGLARIGLTKTHAQKHGLFFLELDDL
jgi:hypothetical protein